MEIWKDVPGYEGLYQASTLGKIKSLDRKIFIKPNNDYGIKKGKILSIYKLDKNRKNSYLRIGLRKNNKLKSMLVHRVVAITFLNNPLNKTEINHINGIKKDNRLENLEWVTRSENQLHKYKHLNAKKYLLNRKGKLNHLSKKVNQYDLNGEFIKTWDSMMDVFREEKIHFSNVSKCCKGISKTAGGFMWEYFIKK